MSEDSSSTTAFRRNESFFTMTEELKETANKVFQSINSYDLTNLKRVVEEIPDINFMEIYNLQGRSVLHSAAIKNEAHFLRFILEFTVTLSLYL